MSSDLSATMMLLPDAAYKAARPNTKHHHLTVAYFGRNLGDEVISKLLRTVDAIGQFNDGPIPGKANGIGMFDAGLDGIAIVDLIDGIGPFRMRQQLERLYGTNRIKSGEPRINTTHGFTPHITRQYVTSNEWPPHTTNYSIDNLEFKFVAVGLWHGDQRYEVSL